LNPLRKIFQSFKTFKDDELIGLWENDLDDGSGLHAIWGWSFQFNKDGSGVYYSWNEQKAQDEIQFSWYCLSPSSIKVKYPDEEKWTTIEYTIKIVDASYSGKLLKLTDNNYKSTELSTEGFWGYFGAIFKKV